VIDEELGRNSAVATDSEIVSVVFRGVDESGIEIPVRTTSTYVKPG